MVTNYEGKHFFLAIGVGILFLSVFFLIFIPAFIANSIHFTPDTWIVIVPGINYLIYGIGCFLLASAFLVVFFLDIRKISIMIGLILAVISFIFFSYGAKPFIALTNQGISYQEGIFDEVSNYSWNNMDQINYQEVSRSEGFSVYEFYFSDGNSFRLDENGFVANYSKSLRQKAREEGVTVNIDYSDY